MSNTSNKVFESMNDELESISTLMSDSFAITKRFRTNEEFSTYIEQTAIKFGDSLIDTLLAYCEINDIEESIISKLITKSLKEKIYSEALDMKLMSNKENGTLDF
jgi:hypothetical protein